MLCEKQRTTIDPFITAFFTCPGSITPKALVDFGNQEMKCWIELVIRFTNTPLRIQVTTGLVGPDAQHRDFVSQLAIGAHSVQRIVQNDKLGTHKQIVAVPLDDVASGYLLFYYTYCRPDPSSPYVFQSVQGHTWTRASRDLKAYLVQHGIDCDAMCPNGRFIHVTRNIGIACFSVLCDFDIAKIRNYCTLLRHQLINPEHIYSPWMKVSQSQHAGNDLLQLRGLARPEATRAKIEVANIYTTSGVVHTGFCRMFDKHVRAINQPIMVRSSSVGTQTEDPRQGSLMTV
jgi:hypothetical protein